MLPLNIQAALQFSSDKDGDELPSPIPRTPEHVRMQNKHDEIIVPNRNHSFHNDKYIGKFVQNISNSLEHSNLQSSGSIYKKVLKLTFGNILAEEINRKRALKREKEKKRANFFKIFSGKKKSPRTISAASHLENEDILRNHFQHWKVETVLKSIAKGFHLTKLRRNFFVQWRNYVHESRWNYIILQNSFTLWKFFIAKRIQRKMSISFCNQNMYRRFFYQWIKQFIEHQRLRDKQEKQILVNNNIMKKYYLLWREFVEEAKQRKEQLHISFIAWKSFLMLKQEQEQKLVKALDKQVDLIQKKYFKIWGGYCQAQKDKRLMSFYFAKLYHYYQKSARQTNLLLDSFIILKKSKIFTHWRNYFEINHRYDSVKKETYIRLVRRFLNFWRSALKTKLYLRKYYFCKWKEYIQHIKFKNQIVHSGTVYIVKRCFQKLRDYLYCRREAHNRKIKAKTFVMQCWIRKWNSLSKIHQMKRRHNNRLILKSFAILCAPIDSYRRGKFLQLQADCFYNRLLAQQFWNKWIDSQTEKEIQRKMNTHAFVFFKFKFFRNWNCKAKLQRQCRILKVKHEKNLQKNLFTFWRVHIQQEKTEKVLQQATLTHYFSLWKQHVLIMKLLHQKEQQLRWRYLYRIRRSYFKKWIHLFLQKRNKRRQLSTQERIANLMFMRDCLYMWCGFAERKKAERNALHYLQIKLTWNMKRKTFYSWFKYHQLQKVEHQYTAYRNRELVLLQWDQWRGNIERREAIYFRKSLYFRKWLQKFRVKSLRVRFAETCELQYKTTFFSQWKYVQYQRNIFIKAKLYFTTKRLRYVKMNCFYKWNAIFLKHKRLCDLADRIVAIQNRNLKFKMFLQFKSNISLLKRQKTIVTKLVKHLQLIKKEKIWNIWKYAFFYRLKEKKFHAVIQAKVFFKWRSKAQSKYNEKELLVRKLTHKMDWDCIIRVFATWKQRSRERIQSLCPSKPHALQEEEEELLNKTTDSINIINNYIQTIQTSNQQRLHLLLEQKQQQHKPQPPITHTSSNHLITTATTTTQKTNHSISESIEQFIYWTMPQKQQEQTVQHSSSWDDTLLSRLRISSLSNLLDDLNK